MPSILDIAIEWARQARTGDSQFLQNLPYVFRLVCGEDRGPCGPDGSALFPLPNNPSRYELELPFSGESAPQQESGVIVEEAGIVVGRMSLAGTTGFKLRPNRSTSLAWGGARFTGDLESRAKIGGEEKISGQMAWWLLAGRCFDAYSEFKKDPALAHKTRLEIHIPKDSLHLEVRPVTVRLARASQPERVTYGYDIQLEVLGEAPAGSEAELAALTQKSWTDKAVEALSDMRTLTQGIAATIDDLMAVLDYAKRLCGSVVDILSDAAEIMNAATRLVEGQSQCFEIPERALDDTADLIVAAELLALADDNLRETYEELEYQTLAMKVAARLHRNPTYFDVAADEEDDLDPFRDSRENPVYLDDIGTAATAGSDSQGQSDPSALSGTRPGDAKRLLMPVPERSLAADYAGFIEHLVTDGDTLHSLAAQHLGDPARAAELAIVNKLSPPYITSGARLQDTLRPGDTIVIPSNSATLPLRVSTDRQQAQGGSQVDRLLGEDMALVRVSKEQWGWAVDFAHGGTDAVHVRGVPNYAQGISTRIRTEQGTCILFPAMGMPRLVGVSQQGDYVSEGLFRLRQQIQLDQRTERVVGFTFHTEIDAVIMECMVQPVGYASPQVIPVTLR